MNQLLIAAFGLTSIYFAMGNNLTRRKYAPIIGLCGQPFWFMAVIPTNQYGMIILCAAYTAVYTHAIWANWGKK